MEKVKIAANEAQPKVKIIMRIVFTNYNLFNFTKLIKKTSNCHAKKSGHNEFN